MDFLKQATKRVKQFKCGRNQGRKRQNFGPLQLLRRGVAYWQLFTKAAHENLTMHNSL